MIFHLGYSEKVCQDHTTLVIFDNSIKASLSCNYTPDLSATFFSNSLIHILSLSNSHNNVTSIQKNRNDKSHRVIVALHDLIFGSDFYSDSKKLLA